MHTGNILYNLLKIDLTYKYILIRSKLWQELTQDGVTHIQAFNSDFDPNLHEAITTVPPTDEFPSGKIVEVLEEGYMYKDRLLKASKVVVSS